MIYAEICSIFIKIAVFTIFDTFKNVQLHKKINFCIKLVKLEFVAIVKKATRAWF